MPNGDQPQIPDTEVQNLDLTNVPVQTAQQELIQEQQQPATEIPTPVEEQDTDQRSFLQRLGRGTANIGTAISETVSGAAEDVGQFVSNLTEPEIDPRNLDPQERFKQKKDELRSAGPAGFRDVSDEEVLNAIEQENRDLAAIDREKQLGEQQEKAALQERIDKRIELKQRAEAQGIQLPEDKELDPLVARQQEQQKLIDQELAQRAPATVEDAEAAITPTKQEVEVEAKPLRNALAQQKAIQGVQQEQDEINRIAAEQNEKVLAEQDQEVGKIDPNRFWKDKNTGQKILAALAIGLGAVGAALTGQQQNQALQLIMKQIEDDIAAQKLTREQALAKKEHAIKLARFQLDKFNALSQDQKRKADIQNMNGKLKVEQDKLRADRAKEQNLKQLVGSGTFTKQQALNAPKEIREQLVTLPNKKIKMVTIGGKDAATEIRKFQNEVVPAMKGMKRLLKLSREGSRLNLFDRGAVASEMKAVAGALRIPFTGPGPMTDQEFARLMDTIGNANKFLAIPAVERKKMETVLFKLQDDLNTRYQNAGITVEPDTNELNIRALSKKGIGRADAEASLRRTGKWIGE